MSNNDKMLMVDADGHVLEPADLWTNYIDPKYRDRAIHINIADDGLEDLVIDGKALPSLHGSLAALGGIESDKHDLMRPGRLTYADGCPPGSYDPAERLKVMDSEEIDISLLYPTIGISWEGETTDPGLAAAYAQAYNRWLGEFCSHDPKRLVPIAHISLLDPEAAVEEVIRTKKQGFAGIYLSPDQPARGGKNFNDPAFVKFWETVQELEMPVAFHVVVRERPFFRDWLSRDEGIGLFSFSFLAMDVIAGFTMMISQGIFEKYPRLKCTVLESGASWIAYWLDRMDHKFEVMQHAPIKMKPSEYFFRQCVISADPDETLTDKVIEKMGADYFIWASDYPHVDASFGVVDEMRGRLASLPKEDQRKVFGTNAMRFYGLTA